MEIIDAAWLTDYGGSLMGCFAIGYGCAYLLTLFRRLADNI